MFYICIKQKRKAMKTITKFNHITKLKEEVYNFKNKSQATKWLKSNARKCGYDWYNVNDMSIEYIKNY